MIGENVNFYSNEPEKIPEIPKGKKKSRAQKEQTEEDKAVAKGEEYMKKQQELKDEYFTALKELELAEKSGDKKAIKKLETKVQKLGKSKFLESSMFGKMTWDPEVTDWLAEGKNHDVLLTEKLAAVKLKNEVFKGYDQKVVDELVKSELKKTIPEDLVEMMKQKFGVDVRSKKIIEKAALSALLEDKNNNVFKAIYNEYIDRAGAKSYLGFEEEDWARKRAHLVKGAPTGKIRGYKGKVGPSVEEIETQMKEAEKVKKEESKKDWAKRMAARKAKREEPEEVLESNILEEIEAQEPPPIPKNYRKISEKEAAEARKAETAKRQESKAEWTKRMADYNWKKTHPKADTVSAYQHPLEKEDEYEMPEEEDAKMKAVSEAVAKRKLDAQERVSSMAKHLESAKKQNLEGLLKQLPKDLHNDATAKFKKLIKNKEVGLGEYNQLLKEYEDDVGARPAREAIMDEEMAKFPESKLSRPAEDVGMMKKEAFLVQLRNLVDAYKANNDNQEPSISKFKEFAKQAAVAAGEKETSKDFKALMKDGMQEYKQKLKDDKEVAKKEQLSKKELKQEIKAGQDTKYNLDLGPIPEEGDVVLDWKFFEDMPTAELLSYMEKNNNLNFRSALSKKDEKVKKEFLVTDANFRRAYETYINRGDVTKEEKKAGSTWSKIKSWFGGKK
jgi:hypothetical protein